MVAIPVGALAVWFFIFNGESQVNGFMGGSRTNIYRTTAGIAGTLLGFSIAGATLVLTLASSERLNLVRGSRHYRKLWKTFFQTIRFLGVLTGIALVCMVVDKDVAPVAWLVIPFCLFLGLSVVRLLRVIWILEEIINIISMPSRVGDNGQVI